MPDKKLTDRRLKPCKSCLHYKACITANYDMVKKTFECEHFEDIDLINRQKAEIERLKEVNNSFTDIGKLYSEIKAEAYEEFAEKLKEIAISRYDAFDEQEYPSVKLTDLDNLLKELVGEDK